MPDIKKKYGGFAVAVLLLAAAGPEEALRLTKLWEKPAGINECASSE
jgi:hypothetical protein